MNRRAFPLLLTILILLSACSVKIYDLQPIIIGTDTPVVEQQIVNNFIAATPSPTIIAPTPTPPLHIAPTAITSVTSVNILEIVMVDGSIGWGIGVIPGEKDKLVLRTADGANTWKIVTPSQALYENVGESYDVAGCFRDADHGWLIFYREGEAPGKEMRVWATENGGTSWTSALLPMSGYRADTFSDPKIGFVDNNTGWVFVKIGTGQNGDEVGLYTTHDGGKSWTAMVTSGSENLPLEGKKTGAVFRDTLEGWIGCENTAEHPDRVLWHTFDGGNSWYQQAVSSPYGIGIPAGLLINPDYRCSMTPPKFVDTLYQCAWSVLRCSPDPSGGPGSEISVLYWTFDRFASWKTIRLPNSEGDLSFYGTEYGWYAVRTDPGADSPFEILFTENGGENWRTAAQLAWDSKLQFITPAVGYGIALYQGMPALVRTTSNGFYWEQLFPVITP